MEYFKYKYDHNHIRFNSHIYKVGSYHYNWHPETEVLVLLKGKVEVCHDSECTYMEANDVIIYSPQCGHATLALEENSIAMVLHIDINFFSSFNKNFKKYAFCIGSNAHTRDNIFYRYIRAQMAKLLLLQKNSNLIATDYMLIESLFINISRAVYEKVSKIWQIPKGVGPVDEIQATFSKMIEYIDRHYRERITLADIAKIGGYNLSYTSQFFKRQLGISFIEYILRMRLRDAAILLANTDTRIAIIANMCGFSDIKAFNTAFKKYLKMTPSEYRRYSKADIKQTYLDDWKEFIHTGDEEIIGLLKVMKSEKDIENKDIENYKINSEKFHKIRSELEKILNI